MKKGSKVTKVVAKSKKKGANGDGGVKKKATPASKVESSGKTRAKVKKSKGLPANLQDKIKELMGSKKAAPQVKKKIKTVPTKTVVRQSEQSESPASGDEVVDKWKKIIAARNEAGSEKGQKKKTTSPPPRPKAKKKTPSAAKKATRAKTPAKPEEPTVEVDYSRAATDVVAAIIKRRKRGITIKELEERTGFTKTKLYNVVSRLRQQGRIKNSAHGVYVKDKEI